MSTQFKYLSRDYQSILRELISVSPELTKAYDPQSENDPMAFIMKCMAYFGDIVSFYSDKIGQETSPATMTQRKIADAYYRMMGYYMNWYRPAVSQVTLRNTGSYNPYVVIRLTTQELLDQYSDWGSYYDGLDKYNPHSTASLNDYVLTPKINGVVPVVRTTDFYIFDNNTQSYVVQNKSSATLGDYDGKFYLEGTSSLNLPRFSTFYSSNTKSISGVLLENASIGYDDPSNPIRNTYTVNIHKGFVNTESGINSRIVLKDGIFVYKLGNLAEKVYIPSVVVIDDSNSEWTRVDDITYESNSGKYFDVYIDEYDQPYLRFLSYLTQSSSVIETVTYVVSSGSGEFFSTDDFKYGYVMSPSSVLIAGGTTGIALESSTRSNMTEGPETPAEAYINSRSIINSSNTLITCSDFRDAINTVENISNSAVIDSIINNVGGDGSHSVMNKVLEIESFTASDSTEQVTITDSDFIPSGSNLIYVEVFLTDNTSSKLWTTATVDSNSQITITGLTNGKTYSGYAFCYTELLPLYYLSYYVYKNFERVDSSALSIQESYINNEISSVKSLNLNRSTCLEYYVLDWMPKGTIYLSESISQIEANALLTLIAYYIARDYHPHNIGFGVSINYDDLVSKIKSYDSRIESVVFESVTYKILKCKEYVDGDGIHYQGVAQDADVDIAKVYHDYIEGSGISPVVGSSQRHWTKYNSYDNSNNANTFSGLRINQNCASNVNNLYTYVGQMVTETTSQSGKLSEGDIELDPSDFFNIYHPYRQISIARFAAYKAYADGADGYIDAVTLFMNNVKISEGNIK